MGTASSGGNLAEEAKFDDETGEALNAAAREIVNKATADDKESKTGVCAADRLFTCVHLSIRHS